MARPVTQKQIAVATGLDPSTVCLALNNRPVIAKATRDMVNRVARELGYVRDPMLGALAAYRRSRRPAPFHGVLGWLTYSVGDFAWRTIPEFVAYFGGAAERAAELGYKLENFAFETYAEKPKRLQGIWRARGVRGVLVCPQPKVGQPSSYPLQDVAAVTLGYTPHNPPLHQVSPHHFANILEICQRLRAAGSRRIGWAVPEWHSERLGQTPLAGYLIQQSLWPATERLAPFLRYQDDGQGFAAWFKREKPDAVITGRYWMPAIDRALGKKLRHQAKFTLISLLDETDFSGLDEDSHEIGRVAIDLLVSLVEHGERAGPIKVRQVLVKGFWRDGR